MRPERDQDGGHNRREHDVHHERNRRDFRNGALRRRCAQHARDEDGRRCAHGGQRNGDNIEYLQSVAYRCGRIGSERSEHELVNVADHDLHK